MSKLKEKIKQNQKEHQIVVKEIYDHKKEKHITIAFYRK